jgi:hypothetical protein
MQQFQVPGTIPARVAPIARTTEGGGFVIEILPEQANVLGIERLTQGASSIVEAARVYNYATFPVGVREITMTGLRADQTSLLRANSQDCAWDPITNLTDSRNSVIKACGLQLQAEECANTLGRSYAQFIQNNLMLASPGGEQFIAETTALLVNTALDAQMAVLLGNGILGDTSGGEWGAARGFPAEWLTRRKGQYVLCDGLWSQLNDEGNLEQYPWLNQGILSELSYTEFTNGIINDPQTTADVFTEFFNSAPTLLRPALTNGLFLGGTLLRPTLLVSRAIWVAVSNYYTFQQNVGNNLQHLFGKRTMQVGAEQVEYFVYINGANVPIFEEPAFDVYADQLTFNGSNVVVNAMVLTLAGNIMPVFGYGTSEANAQEGIIARTFGRDFPEYAGKTQINAGMLVGLGVRSFDYMAADSVTITL